MEKDNLFYLKKIPLFANLGEVELKALSEIVIEKRYRKNSIIFFEGDPGEAVYLIKSGQVKVTKSSEEGGEQILHLLGEGEIFAEVVLFDGGTFPATAQAVADCQLGMVRNVDMEIFVRKNPEVALKLLKIMSHRLRSAQVKIKNLALQDTLRRTVGILLHLSEEHGTRTSLGIQIDLPLSRQELANMVGTSRETVTRILSKLNKEKIISLEKHKIIILDEDELREWI